MNIKFLLTLAVVAIGVSGQQAAIDCTARCGNFFEEEGTALIDSCQRGCRLFQISDAIPGIFKSLPFFNQKDESLKTCSSDCESAYEVKTKEANSCKSGCQFRKEQGANNDLFNFGDGGFSISLGTLPSMDDISSIFDEFHNDFKEQTKTIQNQFGVFSDKIKEKVDDTSGQMVDLFDGDSIGSVFKQLHENVKNIMSNFMNKSPFDKSSDDASKMLPMEHGVGELTVIKSGPGYHEEKTYHVGPDSNIANIIKSTGMNDMLQHENPIEKFMDKNQVEVFEPVKVDTAEGNQFMNILDALTQSVRKPFASPGDEAENEVDLDGPRLPETGLRSRHFRIGPFKPEPKDIDMRNLLILDRNRVCLRDSSAMSWSDWLSCLHVRMGLPNWLLAASVALGVLFTLWICLMIPSNAPKQRLRKQANVETKEVEASEVAVVTMTEKELKIRGLLDLPPSYDDVTKDEKVVVNLEPVHGAKSRIVVDDDDEITEPLPQKKEDQNQSVV